MDLPTIWFLIICLEIGLYIILDGADLGIGLLSLLPQQEKNRTLLMHTVGPIWDANETWLVIAGGTLFGAFPLAYAVVLSALYIPIMILVFGLLLRAVSFEFRTESTHKHFWAGVFGVGSLLAIVGQGCIAGGFLNGIGIANGHFAGSAFDWFSPITIFMTAGMLMSYVVVGYAYLIKKTEHEYKGQSFARVLIASTITFIGFGAATVLLPQEHSLFYTRWTEEPTRTALIGISCLIGFVSLLLIYGTVFRTFRRHLHNLCIVVFALSFLAMIVAIYPYFIPPSLTIYDVASTPATQRFMLWGIGPLLPIVLFYNFYLYRVFNDKTSEDRSTYA